MPATDRRAKALRAAALTALAALAWRLALRPLPRVALALGALVALADLTPLGPRLRALASALALGGVYVVAVLPARAALALLRVDPLRPPAPPAEGSYWIPRAADPPAPESFTRMR